jgi:plasmid stabilization system protein ParE
MTYTVVYEDEALLDQEDIVRYLSRYYPDTPRRFREALDARLSALADMPYMYPAYDKNPAYRKMVVSDYLVFYKVNDAERTIELHRILHGSRDLDRHLP